MVRFNRSTSQTDQQATIIDVLTSQLSSAESQLADQKISVDLDVDQAIREVPCSRRLESAIRNLLQLAISRCPQRGELQISVCRTIRGVELEIADSGFAPPCLRTHAFSPCNPIELLEYAREASSLAGGGSNDELYCTRCPQGGLAWTIVLRPRMAALKVA